MPIFCAMSENGGGGAGTLTLTDRAGPYLTMNLTSPRMLKVIARRHARQKGTLGPRADRLSPTQDHAVRRTS